jgi:hypothetical protein
MAYRIVSGTQPGSEMDTKQREHERLQDLGIATFY